MPRAAPTYNNIQTKIQVNQAPFQLQLTDFTGGWVIAAAQYNLDPKYLSDVMNMELVQGMWSKRQGFTKIGSLGTGSLSDDVLGFHLYYHGTHPYMMTVVGDTLYAPSAPTGQQPLNALKSGLHKTRWNFVDYNEKVYATNGYDAFLEWNGDELKAYDAAPNGSVLAAFNDRLVLANIPGFPVTLYLSDLFDGSSWPALNYITLPALSDEQITAMLVIYNKLLIWTNRAMYSLAGAALDNMSLSKDLYDAGCVSQQAMVSIGNAVYWMDNFGNVFHFNGVDFPDRISTPIQKYIDETFIFDDIARVQAVSIDGGRQVWWHFPTKKITLVYDLQYQSWTRFYGITAEYFTQLGTSLLWIDKDGYFCQYGTGYQDAGAPIQGYFTTNPIGFNALENLKRFRLLFIRGAIQGGASDGFDCKLIVDGQLSSTRPQGNLTDQNSWGVGKWGEIIFSPATDSEFIHLSSDNLSAVSPTDPNLTYVSWNSFNWGEARWGSAITTTSTQSQADLPDTTPVIKVAVGKWGAGIWGTMVWSGSTTEPSGYPDGYPTQPLLNPLPLPSLPGDVGSVYAKIYPAQYVSPIGKTLQLQFRDRTINQGFRIEHILIQYVIKGVR